MKMRFKSKIGLILILLLVMFMIIGSVSAQSNATSNGLDATNQGQLTINQTTGNGDADNNVIYISPNGNGTGSVDNPSNWSTAYKNVNDNGKIIFSNGEYNIVNQTINKNLTLYHDTNTGDAVLNANGEGFIFKCDYTLNINGLKLVNATGYSIDDFIYGGAIYLENGNLTIFNSSFINNTARGGGAIYLVTGNVSVSNSSFINNTARDGGAIYLVTGNGSVFNSSFVNNTASDGGAILLGTGNVSVFNSSFVNNTASFSAGAIYMDKGSVTDSTFISNSAEGGGAIWINRGDVINSTFINNTDKRMGGSAGAVYVHYGNIINSTFINNSADYGGGAVSIYYEANVVGSIFINNTVRLYGGAIYINKGNITGSKFINNSAEGGGAIYNKQDNISVNDSVFINNSVSHDGGAITATNGVIINSTFNNNSAGNVGGAVCFDNFNVMNSSFINNSAKVVGGAILTREDANITSCNFWDNTATFNGGAILADNNMTVTYSTFLDNIANNGTAIAYINNCNANFNWWGNNTPFNGTKNNNLIYHYINATNGEYIIANNWVIMTLTLNATNVTLGDIIMEIVGFNHYTDGVNTYNLTGLLPRIPFSYYTNDSYSSQFNGLTGDNIHTINYYTKTSGNFTTTVTTYYQTLTANFTVNPLTDKSTMIYIANNSFVYGNNTLYGFLLDSNFNQVSNRTVSLNLTRVSTGAWKVYNVTTNIFGYFNLPITLSTGLYEVSGMFNGDKDYNPSNFTSARLTIVASENSTLLTANTFQEKYKAGKNFTGFLLNSEGKPIVNQTIAVKLTRLSKGLSKVYYVTTDNNGQYQLPINLGKGSYNALCTYVGTSEYSSSSAGASLTVTK